MMMDDDTVKDMIEKAGYVDGLRPQWRESVDVIQRIVNLHNQNLLREQGYSREAHSQASEINEHWTRVLQG